jgi:negative regulator of flagellin synthesis FlgM
MVDSIGPKAVTPRDNRIAPVSGATASPPVASVTEQVAQPATAAATSPMASLAAEMSSEPPVDVDHVARIKKAIQDGTFPISPATIADRFLALRMDWSSHDPA